MQVVDVDLSVPVAAVDLPEGADGLMALVRWRGRPIGLVRLRGHGHVSAEALAAAIAEQVEQPPVEPHEAEPGTTVAHPRPSISVVVCTRERPDDLARCLEALKVHAAAGHEVVVVDNAPLTERTAAVAARHPYLYVCEPDRA